jgi:phosphoribosyl-dephospho-CoA transferase
MKAMTLLPLRRHQLAWLGDAAWRQVLSREWDSVAQDCIHHWATQNLPLVVTRHAAGTGAGDEDTMALGLPAPSRWDRRRLALSAARADVLRFAEFPAAENACCLLPVAVQASWQDLCAELKTVGVNAHVYGSYGWELLSGLDHVREGSDVDLWIAVADAQQADAASACLQAFSSEALRLDGELVFADGRAVAWREWLMWRSGRVKTLLVKSINGHALVHSLACLGLPTCAEAS